MQGHTNIKHVKSLNAPSQPAPYLPIFPLRQKCDSSNENLYAHN